MLEAGVASDTWTLLAPRSGVLVHRDAADGAYVARGSRIVEIGGLDPVWVEAELYEEDLALVAVGHPVSLQAPGLKAWTGTVAAIEPWVDPATRRGTLRVVVDNEDSTLVPETFVDVTLQVPIGPRLAVAADAILYTGERRVVFVDEGDDRLVPRDVEVGRRAGEQLEVLAGLEAGDVVVSTGTFVIAAESRIRAAETYWGRDDD